MSEEKWMKEAISLARKGAGYAEPNPLVGAVIVKDGEVIGRGYHARFGQLHAERNALADCREDPSGATIYVTLEPCCHHGKTPPCTEAIIESGIRKVVVGSPDPNPKVAGKGVSILRDAGIEVVTDFMRAECDALNPAFFHHITTGLPFVTLKYAMSQDGKIACVTGRSRWITGEGARAHVHYERNCHMGIMVGIGTILADDPLLTCRNGGRSPIRIICDTHLRCPLSALVMETAADSGDDLRSPRTILATAVSDPERIRPYEEKAALVLSLPTGPDGHIDLKALMEELGKMGISSIYCEGGSTLNWSCLRAGIVSRIHTYIAPKILGGTGAKGPVGGDGVPDPGEAFYLKQTAVRQIGEDLFIESEVIPCSQES